MSNPSRPSPTQAPFSRKALALLGCLLILLGFAFQGTRPLWSRDEGRYTDNALQMVDSGNYMVPAYNADRTNFNKPPMTAWIIAASVQTFGKNTWAVRTPYALAFILTALLLCGMGRKLLPDKPWLPGLIYACTLYPFLAANIVSTDVFLTLFEALAGFGFVHAFLEPQTRRRRTWTCLMWLGFGLAFLTKGPPGLMPLLGIVPFLARRDGWRGIGRLFAPTGLLVFAVAGLGWYAAVVATHPGLLDHYLKYEVYDRVFTSVHDRHGQWYGWVKVYLPALVIGTLPWWWVIARGMYRTLNVRTLRSIWKQSGPSLFLLLWFVLPLLVFVMARSRLPLYLLPLFLPLSLMLAKALRPHFDLTKTWQRAVLAVWVVVLVGVKGGVSLYEHPKIDNRLRTRELLTVTHGKRFDTVVFVRNTPSEKDVDETTPWGMRMYLDHPIHAIAWRRDGSAERACALAADHARILFLLGPGVYVKPFEAATKACMHKHIAPMGTWRDQKLLQAGS